MHAWLKSETGPCALADVMHMQSMYKVSMSTAHVASSQIIFPPSKARTEERMCSIVDAEGGSGSDAHAIELRKRAARPHKHPRLWCAHHRTCWIAPPPAGSTSRMVVHRPSVDESNSRTPLAIMLPTALVLPRYLLTLGVVAAHGTCPSGGVAG